MDRRLIACVVLALALAGCGGDPHEPGETRAGKTYMVRYIDREARVVCWAASERANSGIACLPCADVAPGVCNEVTK